MKTPRAWLAVDEDGTRDCTLFLKKRPFKHSDGWWRWVDGGREIFYPNVLNLNPGQCEEVRIKLERVRGNETINSIFI